MSYEIIGQACAILLLFYAFGMTYYFCKGELGGERKEWLLARKDVRCNNDYNSGDEKCG